MNIWLTKFEFQYKESCAGGCLNQKSPCMREGRCSRQFPKRFRDNTVDDNDGYPEYRRRNTGFYALGNGMMVDNRWVLPYNRALLLKYNSHINVEVCGTIYAVKYLHKYIHKGGDRAEVEYVPNVVETFDGNSTVNNASRAAAENAVDDEIQKYQEGRYISTSEAVWRAFEFPLHHDL